MAITIEVLEAILKQFEETMRVISDDARKAHERITALEISKASHDAYTEGIRLQIAAMEKRFAMAEDHLETLRSQRDKGWGYLAGFAASSAAGGGIVAGLIKLLT
jgi:vacuolar-type H+-ATPase subunit E/Vma4